MLSVDALDGTGRSDVGSGAAVVSHIDAGLPVAGKVIASKGDKTAAAADETVRGGASARSTSALSCPDLQGPP